MNRRLVAGAVALASTLLAAPALAQEKVLNLYSSRHYQTDEALYANFTKLTGIKINRIEAGEDPLIERISNEGAAQPGRRADHGRRRPALARGPARLLPAGEVRGARERDPGELPRSRRPLVRLLDARARDRLRQGKVEPGKITTYEQLADPRWKGKICSRSAATSTTSR